MHPGIRQLVSTLNETRLCTALLDWYDLNARELPWRVRPGAGVLPNPYAVWISEIMLQQTSVEVVRRRFPGFLARWPTVRALAEADDDAVMAAWAGLGYYARARNMISCARIVAGSPGGRFPEHSGELRKLPGIGPYTAAAIAAIAFDAPEVAVDGNVERVIARHYAIPTPLPAAKPRIRQLAARLAPATRAGDLCQGLMDLGSLVCRPRQPKCHRCPWQSTCQAFRQGIQDRLPTRTRRPPRPVVTGTAWVGRRQDGAWLLERRPAGGLLGGMPGWPGSGWGSEQDAAAPWDGPWRRLDGTIRHDFTHFRLELTVFVAVIPLHASCRRGRFVPAGEFEVDRLPVLMRKAHAAALAGLQRQDR